ncbi:hypothetical protein KP509_23G083600 [Ceratopteris richardii]|uniref:Methyltransferase-like protein 5 n=1 Tax=Ceratopteris richardii TaxID=49495 RepID=A0A8T2S4X8_CERRI|nr:hypothetical protein KP509_23G083600 [Ceratopteris richardii]
MKLKQLEGIISQLVQFQNPKIELEQYSTGAHIASRMLYMADSSYDDISGKVVVDLGCGCGTLGVAASLLSADHVIGMDIDADALDLARENSLELEASIDLIQGNVASFRIEGVQVDTVVMNPPFGTRQKGADMMFLSSACQIANSTVYSLHKSSTREHVKRVALNNFGAKTADVLCQDCWCVYAIMYVHSRSLALLCMSTP